MKLEILDANSWRCPKCKKNYFRDDAGTVTMMYFPPTFKDGKNINPDRNTHSFRRNCLSCGCSFDISGNIHDGWFVEESINEKTRADTSVAKPEAGK